MDIYFPPILRGLRKKPKREMIVLQFYLDSRLQLAPMQSSAVLSLACSFFPQLHYSSVGVMHLRL